MALRLLTRKPLFSARLPKTSFQVRGITTQEILAKIKSMPQGMYEAKGDLDPTFLTKDGAPYDVTNPVFKQFLDYYEGQATEAPELLVPAEDVEEWIETAKDMSFDTEPVRITQSGNDVVYGPAGKSARALFKAALEANNVDLVEDQAIELYEVIADPDIAEDLRNPTLPKDYKLRILDTALEDIKACDTLKEFVSELVESKRASIIASALADYSKLAQIHRKEVEGVITTAEPLDEAGLAAAENFIAQKYLSPDDLLNLRNEVDPSILGGCKLRVGNAFGDFSHKTLLDEKINEMLDETKLYYGELIGQIDSLLQKQNS